MAKKQPETDHTYDCLRLKSQLCFPLYACSKEVIRRYRPLLDRLDLTYTQYITMMVLWEHREMNVRELGECLYLDSGTLTPMLKKLESKGYLVRKRCEDDQREVLIRITEEGDALKKEALSIPEEMAACVCLTKEEAETLYKLLYKILSSSKEN
ncbi:MAG: MarR family transcriptional regulator [Lachnospiraceae bacterium]|nr:MarR family transcriptional regulator [Lachnospiraceae bacterium]